MSSRENVRCAVVVTPRSSVPVTVNVHWPSRAGAPLTVPSQVSVCRPGCSVLARELDARATGAAESCDDLRGTGEPVGERLRIADPVPVRREHRRRGRGGVDAGVGENERVRDPAFAAARRPRHERAVERHARGSTGAEADRRLGSELDELDRELVARHADAVGGTPAFDRDEKDPPVGKLADRAPSRAAVEGARVEGLSGVEDRLAVLDEQRPAAGGAREGAPVWARASAVRPAAVPPALPPGAALRARHDPRAPRRRAGSASGRRP